jgi:hypothetical protein
VSSPTSLRSHLVSGYTALSEAAQNEVLGQPTLAAAVQRLVEHIHGRTSQVTTTTPSTDGSPPRTLVVYDVSEWTNDDWRVLSPTKWALNDPRSQTRRADDVILGVVIISAANAEDWHHAAASPHNPRERVYGIHRYSDTRKPRRGLVHARRDPLLRNALGLAQVAPPSAHEVLTGTYPNAEIVESYAPACIDLWINARVSEGHTRETAQFMLPLIASPTVLAAAQSPMAAV